MRSQYYVATLLAFMLVLGTVVFPTIASALPIHGAQIFVQSPGEVIATFLGYSADYTSDLYLDSSPNAPGIIFTNKTTLPGTMVNLGSFSGGTELVFRLSVRDTGFPFFTGPGVGNPDGEPHVLVDSQFALSTTYVGFEDLWGGGDRDYDDFIFSLTNATTMPPLHTPEPSAVLLLGSGLLGLVLKQWRKGRSKKTHHLRT